MATPSHEGDLNVMEMSKMLRTAERPRKSLGQAPTVSSHSQSLHQYREASHPETLQLPTAWQNTVRNSRDQVNKQEVDHFAKSPAPSPAGPVPVPGLNLGVEDMLSHIRRSKLTEGRPVKPVLPVQHQHHHDSKSNVCLIGEDSGRIKWVQPSGPRRSGEGTEDEEQGIVSAETTASGGAVIRITLLAAGFIIGPSGSSVREVSKQTGADIKSWTEKAAPATGGPKRPVRSFVIEGKRRAVVLALDLICDAVDRYKELCEGAYCGQFVPRIQRVRGVDFSYQPPPRNIVPYAAALKGQHPRLSRADDTCPAVPFKRPPAPAKPQAVSFESMSTTSNDHNSDMDTDCSPAHKTNPQHIHSKADVIKSYMKPTPMSTNYSRPQNSATLSSSKKSLLDVPDLYTTPGCNLSHTHYQSDFCTAQPAFPASSTGDVHSWLEQCKVSSNKPSQGTSKPSPAATAPPAGLVEVRPNVWLPSLAIQQAQGDFALALHIAAQGGSFPSEQLPTETSYLNLGMKSATAQFGMKQTQPESPSQAQFDSNPHASIKASYKHHVEDHYASGNLASFTPRSNSMSPVSIADVEGTFDSAIEQEAMHNPASKYMTDYQHYQQQQHSLNSVTAGFDSAYNFKSPVVGVPYVDPSNSFISPQCVLDTNSLFSHNLAGGIEPASKPSNTGWCATATPPLYQATPASDSSSNPHSSSNALGGNAFSTGGNDSAWPAYSNYWQSSASPFSVGHATDAFVNAPIAPMKQPPQHVSVDSAPGTGSTAFSAWGPSAVNQPRHSSSQNSTVHQHGAYYQPGFLSPLKMPWVQGSHPLLRSKGHN